MRSSDPAYRNPNYPYLVIMSQDKYGIAVQIDLYDDGPISSYIPAFRKGSGTTLVFTGKSPQHDTFKTAPYIDKVNNQSWLVRSLSSRFWNTEETKVTAALYSARSGDGQYTPTRILGLQEILRKDGASFSVGKVGDYPATFVLLPNYFKGKFLKEKTNWSAQERPIGGLVFLRDNNELYEWVDRSVPVPVELLGFITPGKKKLIVVIDVTNTEFRPDNTRTKMTNPYVERPFPDNIDRTAPQEIKAAMKGAAEAAEVKTSERSVYRALAAISRMFGSEFFKDRNGALKAVKLSSKKGDFEPGLPPNSTPNPEKFVGPYDTDLVNPFPRLRPTPNVGSGVYVPLTSDGLKRHRVSQRTGAPMIEFQRIDDTSQQEALRILSDKAGIVVVEINSGSPVFVRSIKSPELSGFTPIELRDRLVSGSWIINQILSVLYHHDEPTSGMDISYIVKNLPGLIDAVRNHQAKAATAGD